jgi:4'-phosphopantetheinyl transferase
MPLPASCPDRDEVRVWHAHVDDVLADETIVAGARSILSGAERDRYDRYRLDVDRRMFLLGRTMSRALVGRALDLPPEAWDWREGPHGRPEIARPATALRFNIAHSAGLVVCALACEREVGVDVEDLTRPPIDQKMVRRYCAPDEIADIDAQGANWRDRFLTYWTLKEAYLKARGVGISVPLGEISFSLRPDGIGMRFLGSLEGTPGDWTFHLARPTDRHVMAVAASSTDGAPPSISVSRYG